MILNVMAGSESIDKGVRDLCISRELGLVYQRGYSQLIPLQPSHDGLEDVVASLDRLGIR